ncbi:MAG: SGNH/GDSL hydrolase family protein [Puniceicoccaceae bacterium]
MMNTTKTLSVLFRSTLVLAIGLVAVTASAGPFGKIVSFGDSLSDTGNMYTNSGGLVPPADTYYDGRMSNGILWVEYLAGDLGVAIDDYAYFGAKTDDTNFRDDDLPFYLIGFRDQVDMYLADLDGEKVDNRDLFTVVIGANDFLTYLIKGGDLPISGSIQNTVTELGRLLDAGARHIVIWNVPDLSSTPAFAGLSDLEKIGLSQLLATYNAMLADALAQLSANYKCNIVVADAYGTLNAIISDPAAYGLENVTVPASMDPSKDPAVSLFWDGVHPTTVGHRIVADAVLDAMLEHYVPGQAIGLDGNVPGWARR